MTVDHERTSAPASAPVSADYDQAPVVVFLEITRACALACRHCRAMAQPGRHPLELSTGEWLSVVEEIGRFQPRPILVITGGDPLMRGDLFAIAASATAQGIRTSLSPSVTALVTPQRLAQAYEAGIRRISFSLDGATADVHDGFRGVKGSYERTLWAIGAAQEAGLTVQINTTVNRRNVAQLDALATVAARSGAVLWDLFFLVPTGRALVEDLLSAEEHEATYQWLYDLSRTAPFQVKTTLGQPFRRVVMQRESAEGSKVFSGPASNDGDGVCFVSHIGEIQPSGFLPISCGNVRTASLVEAYRKHAVFVALRDPGQVKGKCGVCPFKTVCGGCRARAYACTGDYLAADPTCPYRPDSAGAAG